MNCPTCNHSIDDHQKRGCYHTNANTPSGLCLCTSTPEMIELAAVKAENVRLREALAEYANPENWDKWYGFTNFTAWEWNRHDGMYNGYDLAQEALKGSGVK